MTFLTTLGARYSTPLTRVVDRIHDKFLLTVIAVLLIAFGTISGLASRNLVVGVVATISLVALAGFVVWLLMKAQARLANEPDTMQLFEKLSPTRREAINDLVRKAVETTQAIVGGSNGDVRATLFGMKGGRLRIIQECCTPEGAYEPGERGIALRPGEGVAGRCFEWQQAILADTRMIKDLSPRWRQLLAAGLRKIVSVPIMNQGYDSVMWVMNVDILNRTPSLETTEDLREKMKALATAIREQAVTAQRERA